MVQKIVFFTLDITLQGGIERVISNLANKFSSEDYKVEIISFFKQNEEISYSFLPEVEITFLSNKTFFPKEIFSKIYRHVFLFLKIKEYLKSSDIIFISTFVNISIYSGLLAYFNKNLKIIAAEHSQYLAHNILVRLLRSVSYKKLSAVVTLTEHDYKNFRKIVNEQNLHVIPNPLILDSSKKASLESKTIITAGRLDPVKGFGDLIGAFVIINKKHPAWDLQIFGEGSEHKKLKEQISKNKMEDRISLKGYTKNIHSAFLKSSIFVCSSKTEAFPMAMLEALSVGLPVVSFDCPVGPKEIIENNYNGLLVENGNIELLGEALSSLMSEKEKLKELGQNAYENAKKYSENSIFPLWEKVFKEI